MADNIFLQFIGSADSADGSITVTGQASAKGFTGAIEVQSFSLGIANPLTIGSATSGSGAGKVDFSSLNVVKPVDSASTALYQAAAEGAHFPQVLLSVVKTAGTGTALTYLQYDFREVFVTGISWSGSSGESAPAESLTLAYGALEISYKVQDASGNPVSVETGTWNVVTNTPTTSIPGA